MLTCLLSFEKDKVWCSTLSLLRLPSPRPSSLLFSLLSSLPLQIWTMADADGDGALTISEFSIAMYLIQRCRGGEPVPPTLPPSLKLSASPVSSPPPVTKTEVRMVVTHSAPVGAYNMIPTVWVLQSVV